MKKALEIPKELLFPKGESYSSVSALLYLMSITEPDGSMKFTYGELSIKWMWTKNKVASFIRQLLKKNYIKSDTRNGLETVQKRTTFYISDNYITLRNDLETVWKRLPSKKPVKISPTVAPQHTINLNHQEPGAEPEISSDASHTNEKEKQSPYQEFIEVCNKLSGKKFRGDKKSEGQHSARIKEGYVLQDFETAILGMMSDQYHKETNFKYLTPEFITRPDKLEKWLNHTPNNSQQQGFSHNEQIFTNELIKELYLFLSGVIRATPDGSEKENNDFVVLCLNKLATDYENHPPQESLRAIITEGMKDKFHAKNITSYKYVFQNLNKIINSIKDEKSKSTLSNSSDISSFVDAHFGNQNPTTDSAN